MNEATHYRERINPQIHDVFLIDGQEQLIDSSVVYDEGYTDKLHELGINGSAIACMEIGDQRFYIADVSDSHVAAKVYAPYKSPNNGETQNMIIDSGFPYLLVHDDKKHGFVTRLIRPNEKIILGRQAHEIDSKSSRFRYKDDEFLSRKHASIMLDPKKGIVVADLGSTNGVKLRYSTSTRNDEYNDPYQVSKEPEREIASYKKDSSATESLKQMYEFFPKQRVEVDGREFLLSDIVRSTSNDYASIYSYAVMYTTINKDGQSLVVPRFLYKSQSDGDWRVAYGVDNKGRFIKEADKNEWHYTQETKLDTAILEALDKAQVISDTNEELERHLLSIFNTQNAFSDEGDTRHEINYYHDKTVDQFIKPLRYLSAGFLDEKRSQKLIEASYQGIGDYLKHLDIVFEKLTGFMPNFSRPPISIEKRDHTLLGQVSIENYEARLGQEPIMWSIASDQQGRVWIYNIRLINNKVSSYGTPSMVFDAGVLTSKPLEYAEQCSGLNSNERTRFNKVYYDITPVLDNLLPIRKYREARGVFRGA